MNNYSEDSHHHTAWAKRLGFVIVLLLVFGGGIFFGSYYGVKQYVSGDSGQVEISKILDLYGKTRSEDVSFDQFWDVWDMVKSKHVDQPVSDVDLFYGAISGMVAGLNDPYSTFFPPAEAKEFARDLAGEFEGIGAEIGVHDGQLTIVAPLPQSPAEKAGLKAGDKIFAIEGKDTFNMTLEQAVLTIRGKKGTTVVLTISHDGLADVQDVSVIRDTITVPTVNWEMKDKKIAYMRLNYFNETTWPEFDKAVREILAEGAKGLVFDMRSNPGGFLQTSIDVASEWIDSGVIVSERFADDKSNEHQSRGKHRLSGMPTVVLVDGGTASGSEIVAGAIQDYGVGTIMGQQTFGKGSVQDFQVLPDGSALKLTIAKWFTPKDRAINGEGITPDVVLDEMFVTHEDKLVTDIGLEKAMELLTI
ncbi:MAG: hypothetical protein CO029_04540 [Candidatus Magasanikbacteria bacterium CG_4_9_14_0_2_um_filter_41_10]|uniref:PDZ domain-containing protein n=1 Tax=Candidatus Magasanikbacteria bacterium CG_4_10_14_0_2_um_filter_41_31 TaxID=1974639 RepID=A0A2M7V401_9BACT|nr:MAG: hypothetical protein AUJ37_02485 [Candidatus Magasanikbacteria bacterium CG1_02_41_34]PIZ93254.1 MAG: hypothetical protein COX83_02490 [Candidatus Magasanikbacteria bacterium CG_4_10_14_0_2_um_filter_41_31]PJC53085.1 MAG: hypothetical protein CO029_04540 [Candidatus Magasanikbacteria bacterium CG_4_9_14_0_2_um_filter_41_10]